MKLEKKMTDDILRLTESKPKDLLKWFQMIYRDCPDDEYPCILYPYLGKYLFYNSLTYPNGYRIGVSGLGLNDIFDIWDYARSSPENFKDIIRQFKELYKEELK